MSSKINKGTGAGGKNTTRNGKAFEKKTSLLNLYPNTNYSFIDKKSKKEYDYFDIIIDNKNFIWTEQHASYKWFELVYPTKYTSREKKYLPDQALYDKDNDILFILEAKTQGEGSVDEKIQTGPMKLLLFAEIYNVSKVVYIYLLDKQFQQPKYNPVFRNTKKLTSDVHFTFHEDDNWKNTIEDIITSYYT